MPKRLWPALLVLSLATGQPRYLGFEDAQPILDALQQVLPEELKSKSGADLAAAWTDWERKHDVEIRGRLTRGDEDSMVNFLFFGTSFTRLPRITPAGLESAQASSDEAAGKAIMARIEDLIRALKTPGMNERILLVRALIQNQGYRFDDPLADKRITAYVLENVLRVLREQRSYAKTLSASRQANDATEDFITRSKLFQERGLSLDTSFRPNYAIERSLAEMKKRGLLTEGSIRRAAVIGPGLDFTDKENGYDFYPLQTLQPFALIDSLLRLGLARPGQLGVTVLDISPRLIEHLTRAIGLARRGRGYTVQQPLDGDVPWTPGTVEYWQRFGGAIGSPVQPVNPPTALRGARLRAVRIRPSVVQTIEPVGLNIVLQHLEAGPDGGFDLIVATNIFVYYGDFEQTLALKNVEKMLRPGGFLLTNNVLLELPGSGVRSSGNFSVEYSSRPGDGDHIVWYRKVSK